MLPLVFDSSKQSGMSDAAVSAMIDLMVKDLSKQIEGKCDNVAILLNEHGEECKQLSDAPEARFEKLLHDNP